MDDLKMNRQLGTKWFTFYTKVRPWLSCLGAIGVLGDFMEYQEVYLSYWWMMIYFLSSIAQSVLSIMVFIKSKEDYEDFVRFVKGVLIFETINISYELSVEQYIQNEFKDGYALLIGVITLVLGYFLWYRLNMKYFQKRIKTCFCRRCGNKLSEDPLFCNKCGTKVINEDNIEFNKNKDYKDASTLAKKCEARILEIQKTINANKTKLVKIISFVAGGLVVLALLGYFGIYPLVSYLDGDYAVYINMYNVGASSLQLENIHNQEVKKNK